MKRFKNILVVYRDAVGDDDALTQATELAVRNGARLTLLEVIEDLDAHASTEAERRKRLSRIASSITQQGLEVDVVVSRGTPFICIIQRVLRHGHDLLMASAERSGGFKELFFGNTSMHLMRKCPCPVWIVNSGEGPGYNRVLAAVDPRPMDGGDDDLNTKILDFATSLALLHSSELHVLNAWDLTGADLETSRSEITDGAKAALLRKNERRYEERLEALLGQYDLAQIDHFSHVARGDPSTVIPQQTHEKGIDIIVMGTVRRSGIAGFFIGRTAELVLRQVECAVLTVKPAGFVTPIALEDAPGAVHGV